MKQQWKGYQQSSTPQQQAAFVASATSPIVDEMRLPTQDEDITPIQRQGSRSSYVRRKLFFWSLRYFIVVVVVGVSLSIPVIVTKNDQILDDESTLEQKQSRNLIFYLFSWLLITWLAAVVSDLVALSLPYAFRFVARYINPAHQKYWRIFKVLRRPIIFLGCLLASYLSFAILVNYNEELAVNFNKDPTFFSWDDVIDDILEQVTLWVSFYLVEKVMILYITVHYHYRSDHKKITHSKDMHNALVTLYEASVYLHPVNSGTFDAEDVIIRNAKGNEKASARVRATSYLARQGIDGYKLTSFFGNFLSNDPKSHWLRPASSYATVERALSDPKSAAALARRIWVSLVVKGSEWLTTEDIAEVLGPYRREEAFQCFKILDENESGDIRLDEMVMTVAEAGRIRHDIYQNMHDIDHCLNTFDWVCLLILAAVMIFFILLLYVPSIKEIQQTLSFVAIGLSFAVGRTFNHFLTGCVFVFFDHPFDIGDRVEIYNLASSTSTSAIVKRQSLLYTVFRRLDNGTDLQISNERLAQKRIENVSRSGVNRQALSLFLDFKTSFQDLVFLRQELETFLTAPDNRRDYQPDLGLSIVNVHELNKMEVRCNFGHKSNWSNEKLRAARSNKFYCALVAAIRKIPLYKPGGPVTLGDEGKPMYTVQLSDEDGARKVQAGMAARAAERIDAKVGGDAADEHQHPEEAAQVAQKAGEAATLRDAERVAQATMSRMPAPEKTAPGGSCTAIEVNEFIGISTTGLRNKASPGSESVFLR